MTGDRIGRAVVGGLREVWGLLVDDCAVAVGVLLAVAVTALLATPLDSGDAVGWVLFTLVWTAMAISLRRAAAGR